MTWCVLARLRRRTSCELGTGSESSCLRRGAACWRRDQELDESINCCGWRRFPSVCGRAMPHSSTISSHEAKHAGQRVGLLETAIEEALAAAPASIRALVTALQRCLGSRACPRPPWSGSRDRLRASPFQSSSWVHRAWSRASTPPAEHPTGCHHENRGMLHLHRVMGQAAWSYQHRPSLSAELRRRQERLERLVANPRTCTSLPASGASAASASGPSPGA